MAQLWWWWQWWPCISLPTQDQDRAAWENVACRLQTLNYCKIRFTILNLEQQAFFVLLLSLHDGLTCYYALHAIIHIPEMQIVPQKLIPNQKIYARGMDPTVRMSWMLDLARHVRCKVTCSQPGADLHRHDGPCPSLTALHTISLLCSQILRSWAQEKSENRRNCFFYMIWSFINS